MGKYSEQLALEEEIKDIKATSKHSGVFLAHVRRQSRVKDAAVRLTEL